MAKHNINIQDGYLFQSLKEGQTVEYDAESSGKGLKATRVVPRARASRKRIAESESPMRSYALAAPEMSPCRSRVDASRRGARSRAAVVERSS